MAPMSTSRDSYNLIINAIFHNIRTFRQQGTIPDIVIDFLENKDKSAAFCTS